MDDGFDEGSDGTGVVNQGGMGKLLKETSEETVLWPVEGERVSSMLLGLVVELECDELADVLAENNLSAFML